MTRHAAFMSYAHRDDDYHLGAITELCNVLSSAVSVAIGEDFEIFLDRKDIRWGQHWPSELKGGVAGGRFLIPVLSPSFFNSDYCRQELTEFFEFERQAKRNDLILPIYYVKTPHLENQAKRDSDPFAKVISERQYRDWRDLRHLPLTDPKVRRKLDSLAEEIVQAIERSEEAFPSTAADRAFDMPVSDEVSFQNEGLEEGAPSDPEAFVRKARSRGLMDGSQTSFVQCSPIDLSKPGTVFRDIDKLWCPEMVVIPTGTFIMGSPIDEEGHEENEEPEHRVWFEKPFALGVYPVTFDEFDHYCIETGRRKPNDEGWGRGQRPVINMNFDDAEAYLAWLSEVSEQTYRLPSEAEWEYACRAGTKTPFSFGASISKEQARFSRDSKNTCQVGHYPANAFGLFDMHGNVWEWCCDCWNKTYDGAPSDGTSWKKENIARRTIRGGYWSNDERYLRSACRVGVPRDEESNGIGFRCARELR